MVTGDHDLVSIWKNRQPISEIKDLLDSSMTGDIPSIEQYVSGRQERERAVGAVNVRDGEEAQDLINPRGIIRKYIDFDLTGIGNPNLPMTPR